MTSLEWQQKAAREVGSGVQNAVFQLALPFGVQGGTFSILAGGDLTSALPFSASAEVVQAALELLPSVGTLGAKVSGPRKGPYIIEITGDNAGQTLADGWLLADGNSLSPPATLVPNPLQNGGSSSLLNEVTTVWNAYDALPDYERFLYTKRDVLREQLALCAPLVDERDGDAESKESQRSLNLRFLLSEAQRDLDVLIQNRIQSGSGQTTAGMIGRAVTVVNEYAVSRFQRGCR